MSTSTEGHREFGDGNSVILYDKIIYVVVFDFDIVVITLTGVSNLTILLRILERLRTGMAVTVA
jgi:hypothetical protein